MGPMGTFLLVASHLLMLAAAVPMALRKVKRNAIYGFRTPATMSDDGVWYEANEFAGRLLAGATVFSAVVCLALYFLLPARQFAVAGLLFLTLALVVAALASLLALRRIVR